MKRNKGITLIALVITIIVLLILAGVAISMLSGENGILKKAGEAKTKTEEAREEESTTLSDMEIVGDFKEKGLKYKCRYGYITGFTYSDKIYDLEKNLPDGYEVDSQLQEEEKKTTNLSTGTKIKKDGKVVATVVIYGDCNGINGVDSVDAVLLGKYVAGVKDENEFTETQKLAMDINHDGKISREDSQLLNNFMAGVFSIDQDIEVANPKNMKTEIYNEQQEKEKLENAKKEFVNKIKEKYTREEKEKVVGQKTITLYNLVGVQKGTKVGDLLKTLPENAILYDYETEETQLKETDVVDYGAIYMLYNGEKTSIGYYYFGMENDPDLS